MKQVAAAVFSAQPIVRRPCVEQHLAPRLRQIRDRQNVGLGAVDHKKICGLQRPTRQPGQIIALFGSKDGQLIIVPKELARGRIVGPP